MSDEELRDALHRALHALDVITWWDAATAQRHGGIGVREYAQQAAEALRAGLTTEEPVRAHAQPPQELLEAVARWCAWGYGGEEYAEQTGSNEHWRQIASELLALPEIAALIDAQAAVSRVEALAEHSVDGTVSAGAVLRALAPQASGTENSDE